MADNPSMIGAYVIGAAVVYMTVMSYLSKKRAVEHKCARCGKPMNPAEGTQIEVDDIGSDGRVTVCPKCASITSTNHKLAYWFFLVCSVIIVIIGIILLVQTTGGAISKHRFLWEDFKFPLEQLATGIGAYYMASLAKSTTSQRNKDKEQ